MQGMKWDNEFGKQLDFDDRTYRILDKRYQDLPSNGGGGGGRKNRDMIYLLIFRLLRWIK